MTAADLLVAAKAKGLMVATAESCTGGLLSGAITDVAGSSAIFDRGFVTYTNAAKEAMLGVRRETLDAVGAVSEEVALEMANGALASSLAQIAVSVTGIAGPGGSEHKPEGRVCFGLAVKSRPTTSLTVDFGPLGRDQVRCAAVSRALELLMDGIQAAAPP